MKDNVKNKKIELFVDNGIDNYRRGKNIEVDEMLKVYFNNEGFFVLKGDDLKTEGYLDIIDIPHIKLILEKIENSEIKPTDTISELLKKKLISFRNDFIVSDEKLSEVVDKLNSSNQNYFPVLKKDVLIGRISKKILRDKIEDLY